MMSHSHDVQAVVGERNPGDMPPLGAEALQTLLARMRVTFDKRRLHQVCQAEFGSGPRGTVLQGLSAVLKDIGIFDLQVHQTLWSRMDQPRYPLLIALDASQWRVLDQVDGRLLFIDDNDSQEAEPAALASCPVICFHRKHTYHQQQSAEPERPALAMVLSEVFRTRKWLFDVVMATVVINLLAVCVSIYAMQVYDRVVPTLAYATLTTLVVGMAVVVVFDWCLKSARGRILDRVSARIDNNLSGSVFEHLLNLDLDRRPKSIGALSSQVAGLDFLRQFFSSATVFSLVDLPFVLMFIGLIWLIGGPIVWVYVVLLPVAVLVGWTGQRRMRALIKEKLNQTNERQSLLVEALDGTSAIQAENAQHRFLRLWGALSQDIARYSFNARTVSNFTMITVTSLSTITFVCALVVGVTEIEAGNLTMGGIIACSILGGRVIAPVAAAAQQIVQFEHVAQALAVLDEVLVLPRRNQSGRGLIPEQAPQSIELQKVKFAYPPAQIERLDFPRWRVTSGERVLLLGDIGAGKSTLLKLLAGISVPSSGHVLVDGAVLSNLDPHWKSVHIGYLSQHVKLFKGSLRTNLDLNESAQDFEILNTAQALGIDRIARGSLEGFDMALSAGGTELSGGQASLVALGRVALQSPRIWLLDEPLASLDPMSARRVCRVISETLNPEDMLIVAAHDPAPFQAPMTRGVVIESGRLAFDGPVTDAIRFAESKHARSSAAGRNIPADFSPKPPRNRR